MRTSIEATIEIGTPDGAMRTFVARPDDGPAPAVVLYMDALGIREELREMTRRVAAAGYYALLPDLFHRAGGPSFDPSGLPDVVDPRMHELNRATTLDMVVSDTGAVLSHAASDPNADAERVGCIGFCMGGRHAIAAAGAFPDQVRAAASVHGGLLVNDSPDSPHLRLRGVRGEVYFAFADGDEVAPREHMEAISAFMGEHEVNGEAELHVGALHGFIFPERYCYSEATAESVWSRWFAMLERNLR